MFFHCLFYDASRFFVFFFVVESISFLIRDFYFFFGLGVICIPWIFHECRMRRVGKLFYNHIFCPFSLWSIFFVIEREDKIQSL